MARVTGPLFSQEARGQFGQSVVFTRRRGQNIVRAYVIPSNPETDEQVRVRIALSITGLITKRIAATDWKYANVADTMIEYFRARVTTGEVWNSALGADILGAGLAIYDASRTAYDATTAAEKTAWQNAATASVAGLANFTRGSTTISAGEQLFIVERGISLVGYGGTFDPSSPVAIVAG